MYPRMIFSLSQTAARQTDTVESRLSRDCQHPAQMKLNLGTHADRDSDFRVELSVVYPPPRTEIESCQGYKLTFCIQFARRHRGYSNNSQNPRQNCGIWRAAAA